MKCLYCDNVCQLQEPNLFRPNLFRSRFECNNCSIAYDIVDSEINQIVFNVVEVYGKRYLLTLDMGVTRTWLGVNEDIGGLNHFREVYKTNHAMNINPQNIKDKIKMLLVFS